MGVPKSIDAAAFAATAVGPRLPAAPGARTQGLAVVRDERAALARAVSVSDVQAVRAKAEAMRVFLRSQDPALVEDVLVEASALSVDAARRIGQMLPEATPGRAPKTSPPHEARFGRSTVTRYRALASIPDRLWSEEIERARAERVEVSGAGMLRLLRPAPDPKPEPPPPPAAPATGAPEPLPPVVPRRKPGAATARVTLTAQALSAHDEYRAVVARLLLEDAKGEPVLNDAGRALPSAFGRAHAARAVYADQDRAVWAQAAEAEAEDVRLGARREA